LTASAGIGAVTLTWTDPADDDLDHIEITWTGGSVTVEKSIVVNRSNSKTIAGLTDGTEYTFTVKAVDSSGNESQGETASATPIDIGAGTAFTIASAEDWTNARTQISTDGNGTSSEPKVYYLDIQGAVSVPGVGSSENTISGSYKTVRLTGSGTLSLSSSGSIFRLGNNNQTLIIDGPTLSGRTDNNAPLVYAGDGTVELWNGTIGNNTSSGRGGGISIASGTFTMSGGTISGNTASNGGGVYFSSSGTFTMSGGTISGNNGGGVSLASGTFTMTGGIIRDNSSTSSNSGGGVYVGNGTFTMSEGTISGNISSFYGGGGGGVYVGNGTFTMSGGTISGNTSSSLSSNGSGGGGVSLASGTFTMTGGTIRDNRSSSYGGGGGVSLVSGTFTMSEGTISGNTSFSYGGGVYVGNGTFTMSEGTISSNTTSYGGGGVYVGNGTFTKTGGTVYGDTDHIVGNDNATDNTATSTSTPGTNGHAVLYSAASGYYYRNTTLADETDDNISTTDTLPAESGDVLNNWTKR
jgi:hypothetical protein